MVCFDPYLGYMYSGLLFLFTIAVVSAYKLYTQNASYKAQVGMWDYKGQKKGTHGQTNLTTS